MVSKTSLRDAVRAHRWAEIGEGLAARPDLLGVRDERGRNWLHHACMSPPEEAGDAIRTVDLLIGLGLGIDDPAFTEGAWKATPLWHAVSRGRSLAVAEHLLKLGADPNYCLFAAAWNEDRAAIRLLLAHGADIEEGGGETPLVGAVAWSKFGPAEELLIGGANPDAKDAKGRTALHLMLAKGSAVAHFELFARHGARGDIPDGEGRTAAELLRRKRDPGYRAVAELLA
jgi:ankyrin repeat protein